MSKLETFKKYFFLLLKHLAPVGLFILLPMLAALYLGHNIITIEKNNHISDLNERIENNLKDIESEIAPESFLLKVGRGAWFTYSKTKNNLDEFWEYYRNLNRFLQKNPDIYVFDKKGNLITPKEFPLKSKFLASKIWNSMGSSYDEKANLANKMKKQFKSFLGNEFRMVQFLEGRNKLYSIIVNTKVGYIYWMNSIDNPKEGILIVFWEQPSFDMRLHNIVGRYYEKFDDIFYRRELENTNRFIKIQNVASNYNEIFLRNVLLGQNDKYIDANSLVWKSVKLNDTWLLAGLKSKAFEYDNYLFWFITLTILAGIILTIVYVWSERKENFYLSIRVKLVGLFLIAVFTPVMGFSFLGYQYVLDMRDNLITSFGNESRDVLLNIDRELGSSGNIFRNDFRKMVKNFRTYDEDPLIKDFFTKSLEKHELVVIERRLASDASVIKQLNNPVVIEGMSVATDAFIRYCIDTVLNSSLLDSVDPVLRKAMKGPELGLSSFSSRPDNVQDFVFGSTESYIYWCLDKAANGALECFFIARATDKVLRDYLQRRLNDCKINPLERKFKILARNDKNGEWFPDYSLSNVLKSVSRRVNYMGKPFETKIDINSKKYLLLGLKSGKLRGYSFYALYPYENIEKELLKITGYIVIGILFFVIMALAIGYILSETFLYPVKRLEDGVKAIKERNSEFRIEALQNDEFGDLAISFNKMIGDLKEMELAKYIQESLLPASVPPLKGYELCFANRMASAVGGDYFDTILLDEENLCIIIGDVSGHGVASALVMAIAKAVLYHGFKETRDLLELFRDLNSVISTYFFKPPVKKMITLFATIINLPTGKAVFTDCGHNFPMKLSVDGQITELKMTGMPVGVTKKIRKQNLFEYSIEPGESIVFYTDGIIEVTGKTIEQYGYDRFKANLSEMVNESANTIMNSLFEKYDMWQDGTEPDDDVTVVVLKRQPTDDNKSEIVC